MQARTNGDWRRWLVVLLGAGTIVAMVSGFDLANSRSESELLHLALGLVIGVSMVVHCLLRWTGLVSLLRGKARAVRSRGRVDIALLACASLVTLSGVALSGWVDLGDASAWRGPHHLGSKLLFVAVVWHLVQHRSWFAALLRRRAPAEGA